MLSKPVLIIDSDESSQQILSELIEALPDFHLAHTCSNGAEAAAAISAHQPQLTFLEIELPGKSGLCLMEEFQGKLPFIITTTQEMFAAKAFNCNAVDYLLKPFARSRFEQALVRYKAWSGSGLATATSLQYPPLYTYPHTILVEQGRKFIGLSVDDITHMKAERDYTRIFTLNKGVFLSMYGISQIEKKMNPLKFLRIHRSYLVNINYIRELYKDISKLFITLPNDVELCVSKRYLHTLKQLMF